jgi:hypothetical protein
MTQALVQISYKADEIEFIWPSGVRQTLENIVADRSSLSARPRKNSGESLQLLQTIR